MRFQGKEKKQAPAENGKVAGNKLRNYRFNRSSGIDKIEFTAGKDKSTKKYEEEKKKN